MELSRPAADVRRAPTGRFRLWVRRNGVLVGLMDETNLIVDLSQGIHAQLLGGDVANQSVTKIGFGSGLNAAAAGNTGLTAPYVKALDGHSYPQANQVQFAYSLGPAEANGSNIGEFGLLTGGDTLYARKVRSSLLAKDDTVSFTGTWTIQF